MDENDVEVIAQDIINIMLLAKEEDIPKIQLPLITQMLKNLQKDTIKCFILPENKQEKVSLDLFSLVNKYIKKRAQEKLSLNIE